jgi:ATP-dependent RNA helicase DDX49/DBP8
MYAFSVHHRQNTDLAYSRELAYQLSEQFLVLGKPLGLTTTTVVGGMDMMQQARELRNRPHVVVATPGRLHDLLKNCAGNDWDLSRVKVVVSLF